MCVLVTSFENYPTVAERMSSFWYRIDLAVFSESDYEPFREDSLDWARSIDWRVVNATALRLLNDLGAEGDLRACLEDDHLDAVPEGLESLVLDPMDIGEFGVFNGGHRATAMLEQGESFTLGYHVNSE